MNLLIWIPTLYSQIRNLKDGEISLPLLEEDRSGLKNIKILKVSNRFEEHIADYSKDYITDQDLALKEKQLTSIKEWMKEKIEEYLCNISKDDKYCDFTNNWSKNNNLFKIL